jgi:uncharacterized integral membrane protein
LLAYLHIRSCWHTDCLIEIINREIQHEKEIVMESNKLKNKTQKLANAMIICMVIAGTVIFAVINQASSGAEFMPTLFLLFFGAIITVQLVPGLVLLATMIKGAVTIGQKKQEPAKATPHNSAEK